MQLWGLAGYAELGITGLMPSTGLCRVILSSLRLADMLSTSNRHNPEELRWWLRGRFVEFGRSTARQLAIPKMKETGKAFCSVSAEAFIMPSH